MPKSYLLLSGVGLAAWLAAATLQAQDQPRRIDKGLTFEVASIKSNTSSGAKTSVTFQPGGRIVMVNAPVTMLLVQAFLIPSSRTIGAPAWTRSSRYDIDARAGGDPPAAAMRRMAQSLLVDRFGLMAYIETREQDGFALARASASREFGPHCARRRVCRTRHASRGREAAASVRGRFVALDNARIYDIAFP